MGSSGGERLAWSLVAVLRAVGALLPVTLAAVAGLSGRYASRAVCGPGPYQGLQDSSLWSVVVTEQ